MLCDICRSTSQGLVEVVGGKKHEHEEKKVIIWCGYWILRLIFQWIRSFKQVKYYLTIFYKEILMRKMQYVQKLFLWHYKPETTNQLFLWKLCIFKKFFNNLYTFMHVSSCMSGGPEAVSLGYLFCFQTLMDVYH